MNLVEKYSKKTIKQLKEDPCWTCIDGRSKLKRKAEMVGAICDYLIKYSGKYRHGSFTGIKTVDMLVLMHLSDKDLNNLCKTSTYFAGFFNYEKLWKLKIISEFDKKYIQNIHDYTGAQWRGYYLRLVKKHFGWLPK